MHVCENNAVITISSDCTNYRNVQFQYRILIEVDIKLMESVYGNLKVYCFFAV